jgi:hypothetical protein
MSVIGILLQLIFYLGTSALEKDASFIEHLFGEAIPLSQQTQYIRYLLEEKALGTIFFARDAASQFGSPKIEPEHLLLGLLHESKPCPKVPNALISRGLCLYDTKN